MDLGSKAAPIMGECRNVAEVIEQGDLSKAALNAGLLALYSLPSGVPANAEVKVGMKSATKRVIAANVTALGIVN